MSGFVLMEAEIFPIGQFRRPFYRWLSIFGSIGNGICLNSTSNFDKKGSIHNGLSITPDTEYNFYRLLSIFGPNGKSTCLISTFDFTQRAQYTMDVPSHQIHNLSLSSTDFFIRSNWKQYLSYFNFWFYKKSSIHNGHSMASDTLSIIFIDYCLYSAQLGTVFVWAQRLMLRKELNTQCFFLSHQISVFILYYS